MKWSTTTPIKLYRAKVTMVLFLMPTINSSIESVKYNCQAKSLSGKENKITFLSTSNSKQMIRITMPGLTKLIKVLIK